MRCESIIERLNTLKTLLKEKNLSYYLIPTGDYHCSEYVSDYFKVREYFSGFTGSNGTLLVGREEVCLWTDGRYFIQAEKELKGTGILLQKMGEKNVPTIAEYLNCHIEEKARLGFDGKVVCASFGEKLKETLLEKKTEFVYDEDLAGKVWKERPAFLQNEILTPDESLFGKSVKEKIELVRKKMAENGVTSLILSKLDDIMWLFNIRGRDVACNPVAFSFGVLTQENAYLYVGKGEQKEKESYVIRPYDAFWTTYQELPLGDKIWLDMEFTSYAVYDSFPKERLVLCQNPTERLKAIKNETELSHIRRYYLEDSVAVTKFIFRMKQEREKLAKGKVLTEYDAMLWMDGLRENIQGYLDKSFTTISAYGENAAMMHYEATKEENARIQNKGMLLVDSGGQYLGATTDVTRTIAMGPVTEEMKLHFTKVLQGMLSLANAKFLYGCTGRNLDILARGPLWELGIDYKCGTGHGVGYILNVHEGPQNIRYRYTEGCKEAILEEGMLVTDEPGVYLQGKYGIRTENVLLVQKDRENEDGQFMHFEMLTYVPIDLELVDAKNLDEKTRKYLNEYHAKVYEKVSPYLSEEERVWLKENTKKVDSFY